jgi:transcriptional regulator with XRE-family HTH domain
MVKRVVHGHASMHCGHSVRPLVCSRLQARRTELGLSVDRIAKELGIERSAYETYEAGDAHVPAPVLAKIADFFRVPVFWLFQDIFPVEVEDYPAEGPDPPRVYHVATLEERLGTLADAFRSLDLEGQQQVLATAAALRSSNARSAHESQRGGYSGKPQSSRLGPGKVQRISRLQNPSSKLK